MIPVAFEGLSATLHPATGRRGILILGSAGFEDLCAHRFLVALGDETARRGLPALRFDLRGFGDSSPAVRDEALVSMWVRDIVAAVNWMQRELGCSEIGIAGLRLGALLASRALTHPTLAGCRLALLAPPASGKAYLRELKVFARVVAAPPSAPNLEGLDLAGYHMPPALVRGIEELGWTDVATIAPHSIAIFGTTPPALAEAMSTARHDVSEQAFVGYERLMCDPTASIVPGAVVRAISSWLAKGALPGARRSMRILESVIDHGCWREEGVTFGSQESLSGVLCTPRVNHGGPLVVFTNPGGIRRAGWGNMWVDMARDLAASGTSSLRFDFTNLGTDLDDSEPAFHYGESIWTEITAAADLAEMRGFQNIVSVGACSGAYHCLRAASFDPRVEAAVLINQLCYDWSPAHAVPLSAWMKQKAGDFDRKRRAVDEDVSELARLRAQLMVRGIKLAKISAKSALRQLRTLAILLPGATRTEVANTSQAFRHLLDRGVRLDIVQVAGDPSVAEFDKQIGLDPSNFPGLTRTTISDADHLLTPHHARTALLARIRSTVESRQLLRTTTPASA